MNYKVMFVGASLGGGGSERVMSIIANAFFNKGNSVEIIRLFDDKTDYRIEDGIETAYIGNKISNSILKKVELVNDLRNQIKKYKPDVIISFLTTCNVISTLAATGLKINVIVSERNDPNNNVKSKFAAWVRNVVYNRADCLVCQTPDAVKYFPKGIQDKSVVIPNPINDALPAPYLGERDKKIVMVCRLNRQKNIPMALNAFEMFYKAHPEWTLEIYGEGEEREKLQKIRDGLQSKNNIIFHGFSNNVIEDTKKAGIFLSTSDYEGISNSMLEAMAMGTPCVVTDCPIGGARMVVKDGENGILIRIKDTVACYEALQKIADENMLKLETERRALAIREKYSLNRIVNMWGDLI